MATKTVRRHVAEQYHRYDAALQPQLDFGAVPAQLVSPLDNNITQATWASDATKLDLNSIEDPAKRKRMRELLRFNGMRRQCGSADEQEINRNGT
jgi:hypothetical protein